MIKQNMSVDLMAIAIISLMALTFSMIFINNANNHNMKKSKYQTLEKSLNFEYQATQSEDFSDRTNQFVIFKINNTYNVRA
jgi:hypothetical protein